MRKQFFSVITICGVTAAGAGDVVAQSDQWCNEYANQAVISATQNKDFDCGLTGGRWGFDYRVHYNWCMTVAQPVAMQERLARQAGIKKCHSDPG
jgi:hypothetical protein